MHYTYKTNGTCSQVIEFDVDNAGVVSGVQFHGGCPGNTFGVSALCQGRDIHELIKLLEGTDCRGRGTSCPDQLAKALKATL